MSNIYDAFTKAICAHWQAHDTKYPQNLVLSPEQRSAFIRMRNFGRDPGQEINHTHSWA